MKERDKNDLLEFGSYVLVFVLALLAIATSAGVWNGVHAKAISTAYAWFAGFNLIAEGFGIYKLVMWIRNKFNKD